MKRARRLRPGWAHRAAPAPAGQLAPELLPAAGRVSAADRDSQVINTRFDMHEEPLVCSVFFQGDVDD